MTATIAGEAFDDFLFCILFFEPLNLIGLVPFGGFDQNMVGVIALVTFGPSIFL